MCSAVSLWRKIRLIAGQSTREKALHVLPGRDPDLLMMAEMTRRKMKAERNLETVFEKAKPILRREVKPVRPARPSEIPADLKAQVSAMDDPEQRIRAIVEFKLSGKMHQNHQD
jgi:hypothetical protein